MGACEHLLSFGADGVTSDPAANAADPAVQYVLCPDCEAVGATAWAHLRKCVVCGHVGCCDSSPYRHASKHHEDTGHPVMRSFEPGESWRWCYVDRRLAPQVELTVETLMTHLAASRGAAPLFDEVTAEEVPR